MDKYKFLSKYTLSDSKAIPVKNSRKLGEIRVPEYWLAILDEKDIEKKKNIVLNEWKKYVKVELRNTIQYLESFLKNIELFRVEDDVYLLYTIESYQTNKTMYYAGGNPLTIHRDMNDNLKALWGNIPIALRNFYEKLHDGFYYYPSQSMGLDKMLNIESMDDVELPLNIEPKINIQNTYNFLSTGSGSYVTLDITNDENVKTMIWLKDFEPMLDLEFWDAIDEYYYIGFDE
ncbi:hypothetical protein EQG49_04255 [Periweissella cryptocerci]|uniref:SMI1/KNR4 family protein n=1 Tax=Periweissella cryptocerci TaxID=2506420 RepID=A0A4P6YSN6_9LACO|nr:hypothetical protein [Periweissella cryptocerci]QBO35729.1 hypothetical protein EQG49_04255 [Periweissella cryptocerci]